MPDTFAPFDADGGLIFAVPLPGGPEAFDGSRLGWEDLAPDGPADERAPIWVHLDRSKPRAQQWIRREAKLPDTVADALLAEETRPRAQRIGDGFLVLLRGVNMNPGAEPDELITLRMWIEAGRIITLRLYRFQTVADLREAASRGEAPATPGGLLSAIALGLALRLEPSVLNLEEMVDEVEEGILDDEHTDDPSWRSRLATIRRQAIAMRRHVVPQRDALVNLANAPTTLLTEANRLELHSAVEQVMRASEGLEEARDRAAVTQDELRARHEMRLGRTLYLLTIVATVALPLGLITGLLGINVGGIPLAESSLGFLVVCSILVAIAVGELMVFRFLRWL